MIKINRITKVITATMLCGGIWQLGDYAIDIHLMRLDPKPETKPSSSPVPFQGLDGPPEVDQPALEPLKGSDGPLGSGSESRGEDNWQCWRCGRMVHGDQPHCACLMEEIGE